MLWGVVTGMAQCGVVLRWADVQTDDAPRKVPEAFRGAVGGVEEEEYRSEVAPGTRQIHQAMQPISHTRRNQPNGAEWRAATQRQTIDRLPTGSTIHCLPRQAASRAKPKSKSTSESRSKSRSKRVVAGNQSPITEGRRGEGKWINRSEQVGVDNMTGIISMAKCGR